MCDDFIFFCLIIPEIVPNSIVSLQVPDTSLVGFYTVAKVMAKGDNWGNDTVQDYNDDFDLIDLSSHTTITDINDSTISQSGSDTVIDDGNGNSITLIGVDDSLLTSDDFIF